MVFGKLPPDTAHQAAHGQVEARRAVLALVVTVRREFEDFSRLTTVPQDVCHGTVHAGIAATALFIVEATRVSHAGEHPPMPDTLHTPGVSRQPSDRTY